MKLPSHKVTAKIPVSKFTNLSLIWSLHENDQFFLQVCIFCKQIPKLWLVSLYCFAGPKHDKTWPSLWYIILILKHIQNASTSVPSDSSNLKGQTTRIRYFNVHYNHCIVPDFQKKRYTRAICKAEVCNWPESGPLFESPLLNHSLIRRNGSGVFRVL